MRCLSHGRGELRERAPRPAGVYRPRNPRASPLWPLALNQGLGAADERIGYAYLLRVIGFVLILVAIIDKNLASGRRWP